MKTELYKQLVDTLGDDCLFHKDVRIEVPNGMFKSLKRDYDLIVFHPQKIILFVCLNSETEEKALVGSLRVALLEIANKLSLGPRHFIAYGVNDERILFLNSFNDRLMSFELSPEGLPIFFDHLETELSYSHNSFDPDDLLQLSDSLVLSSHTKHFGKSQNRTMTTSEGNVCVYKHGRWHQASEINTESFYLLTVFGGMLGMHLFHQGKIFKGILYLLTFGLFGVGWFFDSLEILLGMYKDSDGRYLIPLENKLRGFLFFLAGIGVFCILGTVYMLSCRFLLNLLSDISSPHN